MKTRASFSRPRRPVYRSNTPERNNSNKRTRVEESPLGSKGEFPGVKAWVASRLNDVSGDESRDSARKFMQSNLQSYARELEDLKPILVQKREELTSAIDRIDRFLSKVKNIDTDNFPPSQLGDLSHIPFLYGPKLQETIRDDLADLVAVLDKLNVDSPWAQEARAAFESMRDFDADGGARGTSGTRRPLAPIGET